MLKFIKVVPDTKEQFYKDKNFFKNCSTKNMKESDVTGLTDTPYKEKKKAQYIITFIFGEEDKVTYPFYGTRREAQTQASHIEKVFTQKNYKIRIEPLYVGGEL